MLRVGGVAGRDVEPPLGRVGDEGLDEGVTGRTELPLELPVGRDDVGGRTVLGSLRVVDDDRPRSVVRGAVRVVTPERGVTVRVRPVSDGVTGVRTPPPPARSVRPRSVRIKRGDVSTPSGRWDARSLVATVRMPGVPEPPPERAVSRRRMPVTSGTSRPPRKVVSNVRSI